jgi:hypothetical protein
MLWTQDRSTFKSKYYQLTTRRAQLGKRALS